MRLFTALVLGLLSVSVVAQESDEAIPAPAETTPEVAAAPAPTRAPTGEATISLQTTVTGNQEQPRVLYILPWQSPEANDIEFETLSSQYDEVFGHLEREELRRSLEAEAALNKAKP